MGLVLPPLHTEWTGHLRRHGAHERLAKKPGVDRAEFDRASHDEAWGCASSQVWRAYLDILREAA